jgi:putative transposase
VQSPVRLGFVSRWLGVKTLFIEPGSPWENGYCESFNSKLRDELLNGEARVPNENWRRHDMLLGRTRPSAIGRLHQKPSCRQPVAGPTLCSGQPAG